MDGDGAAWWPVGAGVAVNRFGADEPVWCPPGRSGIGGGSGRTAPQGPVAAEDDERGSDV